MSPDTTTRSQTTPTRGPSRAAAVLGTAALVAALGATLPGCKKGERVPSTGVTSFAEMDFAALPDDLGQAIAQVRRAQPWATRADAMPRGGCDEGTSPADCMKLLLDRDVLTRSFELGTEFLLRWQLPEGNFRYMYDWLDGTWVEDDNQVRQAGSLWGVALCHRYRPTPETRSALDRGLRFWFDNTVDGPEEGTRTLVYPGERSISSGTVGLVALSIVELLKTDDAIDDAYRAELEANLDGYLRFLQWMQLDNGHISRDYRHDQHRRLERSSPYYDGESLLCLCKAARELGRTDLVPTIETAAAAMARTYTIDAWAKDIDSKQTKGFYQWGSMSFWEYTQAGWKDAEVMGDVTLALGWWMIHTHETLSKGRNHAYAVEGLVSAYRVAEGRGDVEAQTDLLYAVDRSLHKLGAWQIGGPLASDNKFLLQNPTEDEMAIGGVMNARKRSGRPVKEDVAHQLRIDVTQHQMHAVTLALESIYTE